MAAIPAITAVPTRRTRRWILLVPAGFGGLVMVAVVGAFVGAANVPAQSPIGDSPPSRYALKDIPPRALALYLQAGQAEGIRWAVLAAVGKVETDHCRSRAPGVHSGHNGSGAAGCMQFLDGTWARYGHGGDPYTLEDSIPAAARYLVASGAPADYHGALLAYNHAEWYVQQVLALAARYEGPVAPPAGGLVGRITALATSIEAERIDYCYGGGHVQPARPSAGAYCWVTDTRVVFGQGVGLDCSSSVSMLFQHAGMDVPTMTSSGFMGWGKPGPGRHVTVWASPTHVFLVVDGRTWQTSMSNFHHGPGWTPGRSHAGFVPRHPPNL